MRSLLVTKYAQICHFLFIHSKFSPQKVQYFNISRLNGVVLLACSHDFLTIRYNTLSMMTSTSMWKSVGLKMLNGWMAPGSNIECCNKKFVGVCTSLTLPARATTRKSCSSKDGRHASKNQKTKTYILRFKPPRLDFMTPRILNSLPLCPCVTELHLMAVGVRLTIQKIYFMKDVANM